MNEAVKDSEKELKIWLKTPHKFLGFSTIPQNSVLRVQRLLNPHKKFNGHIPMFKDGDYYVSPGCRVLLKDQRYSKRLLRADLKTPLLNQMML